MTPKAFYYLNSNVVRVTGLRNNVTKAYITNLSGVAVSIVLNPLVSGGSRSMAYVANSNGVWETIYPSDVGVVLGSTYIATITADGGVSLRGVWNVQLVVEERQEN